MTAQPSDPPIEHLLRELTMRELGLCSDPDTPVSLAGIFDTKSASLKNNQP